MKKYNPFFKIIMVALMLMPILLSFNASAANQGVTFTDVRANHKYSTAIYTLVDEGIIDGTLGQDNTYSFFPDQTITRAEVSKMLATVLAKGDKAELSRTTSEFHDLPLEHWANKYVAYAVENNIIAGYGDSSFQPAEPATFGEVVKMLVCIKGYEEAYQPTTPWYDGYIDIANELQITENVENSGDKEVTRAQVAQMIYNLRIDREIPKLYFEGNISEMYEKSDVRNITVKYSGKGTTFEGYAKVKVQGTSSLAYDKKNYTIDFYQDASYSKKMPVDVGWGEQSKYCLKANWIDKTHARNIVTARLVSQVQKKYGVFEDTPANGAIDGFPIEIYSNDEFLGIYTFNIPKDAWMFNMDTDNPNHIVFCGELWEPGTLFTGTPVDFTMWSVEVGKENKETLAKLNRMCEFVVNSSDEEFKQNFSDYIDFDAALNYYIMADFAYLNDNLGKNMLLVTYDGLKWYPSLYDLDTSWGTLHDGKELLDYHNRLTSTTWSNLFKRMEQSFPHELSKRYFELRERILTKENVMSKFEFFESCIPQESFEKEVQRWGTEIPGYGISQIENYLDSVIYRYDQKYLDYANR